MAWLTYIALKMRAINKGLEVAAPTVLWMQGLPIRTQRREDCFVPNDLSILEKIQIYRAPL
jgi:hypothetical protein